MKLVGPCCIITVALALCCRPVFSAELVVLQNRSVIRTDRHEMRGEMTRLYLDAGFENFVDVPGGQIERFEQVIEPTVVSAPPPAHSKSLGELVVAAGSRYGVDPDLIFSLIHAESGFDPHAVSPKGAQGLMQLMPQTALSLGVENPIDAAANVDGGTRYLRELLLRYNQDISKALAAYNAGPLRIQQFHGVPPFPETIAYVTRVERDLSRRKLARSRFNLHLQPERTKRESSRSPVE